MKMKKLPIILPLQQARQGESILWSDVKVSGIFFRHVKQVMAITNYHLIIWREKLPQTTIKLSDITAVEVLDRRNSGSSHYMGYSFGSRQFRNYRTIGDYTSKQLGTLVFFIGASPVMTWYGIVDPISLRNLVVGQIKRLQQHNSLGSGLGGRS
jgi:hypothetical protein